MMIKIDTSNLAKVKRHGLSAREMLTAPAEIKSLLKKIEARGQGFYTATEDRATISRIMAFAKQNSRRYRDIVVLGIGGSALGTICLAQSLKHLFRNELSGRLSLPHLHVLDNIDPSLLSDFNDLITPESTLFIVVTKSGSTPETLAQYFWFAERIKKEKLRPEKHFVFITGNDDGPLKKIADRKKIQVFNIPENIGGRFSVLTAVGLLPAALIGIDIGGLLKGADDMKKIFLTAKGSSNLPHLIAKIQYLLLKKGKKINVLMPYSQKLITFADWFGQLLAESVGKEGRGITPVSALGATDQHSQNQLYNEGPNDKFFIFIKVARPGPSLKIRTGPQDPSCSYLDGLTFGRLLQTEMEGTIGALTEKGRPNITINIPAVDEYHLGALFMLFEASTAFLGEMLKVNAYDQPGVERSKQITRTLLTKQHVKKDRTLKR